MATTVSRRFRDSFDAFAAHRVDSGAFTDAEMEEFRALVRIDLRPGPDQLRGGVDCLTLAGVKIPAKIDSQEDRYRLWDEFFRVEVERLAREDVLRPQGNGVLV